MSNDYRPDYYRPDKDPAACEGDCQFVIIHEADTAACESGSPTCNLATLLTAEPSGFHDASLIDATIKINEILAAIPADSRGRQLSMLHTKWGLLLAWVDHKGVAPADGVRPDADDATIAKALRLRGDYSGSGAGANSY